MNRASARVQAKLRLAIALLLFLAATCSAETGLAVTFRMTRYSIERSATTTPADAERSVVQWEYPVMVGARPAEFERLNGWLREKSVEVFAQCMSSRTDELLKLSDKKLVNFLRSNPAFLACEADQSLIEPAEAFGQYITFRRLSEYQGLARPQHGIELLVFDLRSNKEASMASLFKQSALEALNGALVEVIERTRPSCHGRSFVWSQVSLRPPNRLFIEFPYNPTEWEACGDGVESLSGQSVSSQLRSAAALRPARSLVEVR